MKKIAFALIFVFGLFAFSGCSDAFEFKQDLTNYAMEIEYNDEDKTLSVRQTTDYVNSSDNTLDVVKFHLYANAFREGAKAKVVSVQNEEIAYPNGKSFGNIEINSVSLSEKEAQYSIEGEDENIICVTLAESLYPNESVIITFSYTVTLANINHRLGYGENAINLCNFYPIACMYEDGDFVCDLYNSNGDPFYSDVADYNVEISYPNSFVLASTGNIVSQQGDDITTTNITAQCVRDFGMVLSQKFEQKSKVYDQRITLNYYYYDDENSDQTLNLIEQAMQFFETNIGKYPYSQVSVVETNFVHGGMEYPNIMLISDQVADYETYTLCIVHELCHQWWYSVVGNNQFDYGWIDEGLTEFCTVYFFEKNSEYNRTMKDMIASATQSYVTFARVYESVQGEADTSMNRALDQFSTEPEYVYNTYVKGTLMFSSIYDTIGEKAFVKALKYYYEHNLYGIATPTIVIQCFSNGSGRNLRPIFESYLEGKVVIK